MIELSLRKMSPTEFEVFRAHVIKEYAKAHISVGNWSEVEAQERAINAVNELLPDGEETDQALVLTATNAEGDSVGYLWIGLQRRGGAPGEAWIYDIEIYERYRGKGYGRALVLLAEEEVRKRGVKKLGLNVFGNNIIAKNLYDSVGYRVTSTQMIKDL